MSNRILKFLDNIEMIICSIMLCSLVGLQFIQVISRYVFGSSISWAEELSRFALLALVYISSAIGARYGSHIRITAQLRPLSDKTKIFFGVLSTLVWIAFNCVVIWYSMKLIDGMAKRPYISGALLWDMRYIYAIIPLGFALQTLRLLQLWYLMIKHKNFTPVLHAGD